MKKKVVFPFRHHKELFSQEAKQRLIDAGFDIVSNDTGEKLSWEQQRDMIRDAFAIVAGTEVYDEKMIQECKDLGVIMRFGVGTDNFALNAMKQQNIQVGVIANHNAVAEFALTLILATMKRVPIHDMTVRDGKWVRYSTRELTFKTIGIVGFGRIGRRLAELLRGFDVKLIAYDPMMNLQEAALRNVTPVSFEELLRQSDVVTLHLPLTDDTYHIIDEKTISLMKDGAYLINTARGTLIGEHALIHALETKKLEGAGLDVYEMEPVSRDNPLFHLENDVLTPHVSALTYETNYNAAIICAESIISVAHGGRPVFPVI